MDEFHFCSIYNVKLNPHWIHCEQNELADHYIRINDTDTWAIDEESFELISISQKHLKQ